MNELKIQALASELAKNLRTPEDLSNFSSQLMKLTVEGGLNAEMDNHLGYERHEAKVRNGRNSRNGYSKKSLKGNHGAVELCTPRDRDSSFEPQIVSKGKDA